MEGNRVSAELLSLGNRFGMFGSKFRVYKCYLYLHNKGALVQIPQIFNIYSY